MEKRVPHHDLRMAQALVARAGVMAFTVSALRGGAEMGLTVSEMLAVMARLERRHFYKSMTTFADHRCWQDVYHAPVAVDGDWRVAYIKITVRAAKDGPIVIQFKEQ